MSLFVNMSHNAVQSSAVAINSARKTMKKVLDVFTSQGELLCMNLVLNLILLLQPYLDWGKPKWPPRVFAKYLKNGSTDLQQTLRLLRQLYMSPFKIESLEIGHALLPW